MLSTHCLWLIDVPMYCAYCCVGAPFPPVSSAPKRTADGMPACENCGRQLSKVKYTHPHEPGRACHPRCKSSKRTVNDVTVKQPPAARSHKRAKSDPGEEIPLTATRTRPHRITAPRTPAPTPKPRLVKSSGAPVDPMTLLDAAHARRMALIEADKNGAGSSATNGSAVVWQ